MGIHKGALAKREAVLLSFICGRGLLASIAAPALAAGQAAAAPQEVISTPEGAATEAHFELARADLLPMTQQALSRLRDASADVRFVSDAAGRIVFLSARDLLPATCVPPAQDSLGGGADAAYAEAVKCFLERHGDVLLDGATPADWSFLRLASVAGGVYPGEVKVNMRAYHDGLPVAPGRLNATFADRRLLSLATDLSDPSKFAAIPSSGVPELALVDGQQELSRYVSALTGRVMRDVDDERAGTVLTIDEASNRVVAQRPRTYHAVPITSSTHKYAYGLVPTQHICEAANLCSQGPCPTDYSCNTASPRRCEHFSAGTLNVPANPYGTASSQIQAICRDATGTQDTQYCGLTNFFHLCAYTLGRIGRLSYPRMRLIPSASQYQYEWATTCLTNPWGGVDYGTGQTAFGYLLFPTLIAYQNLSQIADLFEHWTSYFPAHAGPQLDAWANATDTGFVGGDPARISFDGGYTNSLSVAAHEYGHYIHYVLSHDATGFMGTGDVIEGFASTLPLRLAIYNIAVAQTWAGSSATYDISLTHYYGGTTQYKHHQQLANGEYVVEGLWADHSTYTYWPSSKCGTENYACGSVMSEVYWELAWDRCRLSYGSCGNGAQIIQSGPYYNWAWALANSAFAYAIDNIGKTGNTGAFLNLVDDRYRQFWQTYGFMSASDYARVQSVLAHHCTGYAAACGSHRLPGSPLPSAYTTKYLFFQGESPTSISQSGAQFATDSAAAGGYYIKLTSNGWARWDFSVPAAGNYKLKAVTKPQSGSANQVLARFDLQSAAQVSLPSTGSWQWADLLSSATYLSAGSHSVTLQQTATGVALVDAFVVDPVPSNFGVARCGD
ncbi:MAG: hypothetical protein IT384_01605 [Deltaproteobacteria bacterium]|nr:hypothetical protein [Deltaproteobacteria bacterium]